MTFDWDGFAEWAGRNRHNMTSDLHDALLDLHERLKEVESRDHLRCVDCGGRMAVDADGFCRCMNPFHERDSHKIPGFRSHD